MIRFPFFLSIAILFVSFVAPWSIAESPNTSVLRSFERVVYLEEGSATSASASVGDVNGDGNLDIVLAKGRHWPLVNYLMLGDGKGSFSPRQISEIEDRTYSAAVADVNGDQRPDLVVSNDRPDRKVVYFNEGNGKFKEHGSFGAAEWPTRYVTLADMNGDDHLDILIANRSGEKSSKPASSYICYNDGHGIFSNCRPIGTESATMIVAGDFDRDGANDLFVPHRDGGESYVLWNDKDQSFANRTRVGNKDSRTRMAAAGDFDRDGMLDLVAGGTDGKGIIFYRNQGERRFEETQLCLSPNRTAFSVAVADLNRDGSVDLAIGYEQGSGSVFFNDGTGRSFDEVEWTDGVGAVYGIAIGDFDLDGWLDLVAARSGGRNSVWFNDAIKSR